MGDNTSPQQSIKHLFKRGFLTALIISLVVSAIAGIIIFLLGNFEDLEMKILLTTFVVGVFSLTGLINASLLDKGSLLRIFGYYSLIISVYAAVLILLSLWVDNFDQGQMAVDFTIVALTSAHISLLLIISITNYIVLNIRVLTIFCVIVVGCILIYLANNLDGLDNTFYYRLLGVFAILDALGTITTPILNKLNKP